MSVLSAELQRFLDEQNLGVLATRSSHGHVHQSPVYYARQEDRLLISTVADRRKALDVEETRWASMCVLGHTPPFPSLTVSGAAALRRDGIGPATAAVMQQILGLDEPSEPQPDSALAEVGRVILEVKVDHIGPQLYIDTSEPT